MEKNKEDFEKKYKEKLAVSVREIILDDVWNVTDVTYDKATGKYVITAKNKDDGRKVVVARNKQYVDNLIAGICGDEE